MELLDLTYSTMNDGPTCEWLDLLAKRPVGHYSRVRRGKASSATRREMQYAVDLLISSVTGHHTGLKGGISTVDLPESARPYNPEKAQKEGIALSTVRRTLPPMPGGVRIAIPTQSPASFAGTDCAARAYEILIDPASAVQISEAHLAYSCHAISAIAMEWLGRTAHSGSYAIPLVIDAMKTPDGELEVFEVHIPGRSFGLHYLPLLWAHPDRRTLEAVECFASAVSRSLKSNDLRVSDNRLETEFHSMDKAWWDFVAARCPQTSLRGVTPILWELTEELSIGIGEGTVDAKNQGWTWLLDRHLWRLVVEGSQSAAKAASPRWRFVQRGNCSSLLEAAEALGPWFVAKPRTNYPWWFRNRLKNVVASIYEPRRMARVEKMLREDDILLERLNVGSLDRASRTGEFRFFWVLVVS